MKRPLYFLLLIISILTFVSLVGCEKDQPGVDKRLVTDGNHPPSSEDLVITGTVIQVSRSYLLGSIVLSRGEDRCYVVYQDPQFDQVGWYTGMRAKVKIIRNGYGPCNGSLEQVLAVDWPKGTEPPGGY